MFSVPFQLSHTTPTLGDPCEEISRSRGVVVVGHELDSLQVDEVPGRYARQRSDGAAASGDRAPRPVRRRHGDHGERRSWMPSTLAATGASTPRPPAAGESCDRWTREVMLALCLILCSGGIDLWASSGDRTW